MVTSRATSSAPARPGAARLEWLIWLTVVPTLAIVAAAGFLGRYVRPILDDYRMAVYTRDGGVSGIAGEFYERLTGRVGNGIIAGLIYGLPESAQRCLPLAVFIGLVIAFTMLVQAALPAVGYHPSLGSTFLGGFGSATIVLVGQPHMYQTLFWTPGIITHTIPPMTLMVLCASAFFTRRRLSRILLCVFAFSGGAFLATVSEPAALVWFTIAGLVIVTHVLFARRITFPLVFSTTLTVGFVGGLVILWTSPGNTLRRAGEANFPGSSPSPFSLDLLGDTLRMSGMALVDLACGAALFAAFAVGLLIGLTARRRPSILARSRATRFWAVACPALSLLLADFAVQYAVRYGYGPHSARWGGNRTWLNFTPTAVLTVEWLGVLTAQGVRRGASRPRLGAAQRALVGVTASVLLLMAQAGYAMDLQSLGQKIITRAAAWEDQRARIEQARATNESQFPYRPLPIDGLQDAFMLPRRMDWVTDAVRRYYQFDGIVKIHGNTGDRTRPDEQGSDQGSDHAKAHHHHYHTGAYRANHLHHRISELNPHGRHVQ